MTTDPVNLSAIRSRLSQSGHRYAEFLRVRDLSVGLYRLPAGSTDQQEPHNEDEVYYVVSGQSQVQVGNDVFAAETGGVIYVPKNMEHRFFDIKVDLELLVFFAPAET